MKACFLKFLGITVLTFTIIWVLWVLWVVIHAFYYNKYMINSAVCFPLEKLNSEIYILIPADGWYSYDFINKPNYYSLFKNSEKEKEIKKNNLVSIINTRTGKEIKHYTSSTFRVTNRTFLKIKIKKKRKDEWNYFLIRPTQ